MGYLQTGEMLLGSKQKKRPDKRTNEPPSSAEAVDESEKKKGARKETCGPRNIS